MQSKRRTDPQFLLGVFTQKGSKTDLRMTENGRVDSLRVPLGSRSGPWDDFSRLLMDFRPLLETLGDPLGGVWEPLGLPFDKKVHKKHHLACAGWISSSLFYRFLTISERADLVFHSAVTDRNTCPPFSYVDSEILVFYTF